jgi:hypothetical protein
MQLCDLGRCLPRKDLLEVVIRYVLKAIAAIGK